MVADAIPSRTGQAFAEGADDKIRVIYDSGLLYQAPASLPQDAQGMGLIHQQHCAMSVFYFDYFADARLVAQHAVYAFDDNQCVRRALPQAFQAFVQVVGVIVAEPHDIRAAQPATVVDAGMAVCVYDDGVFVICQAGNHRQVCLVAGGEYDGFLAFVERGDFLFQCAMPGEAAVGHPGSGCPGALLIERRMGCVQALFIEGEPQVVVGARQDRPAPVYERFRRRVDFFDGGAEGVDTLAQQLMPVLRQGLKFGKQAHIGRLC